MRHRNRSKDRLNGRTELNTQQGTGGYVSSRKSGGSVMGAVHRTATKSLGRPHPVHVKRMSTYDKLVADMELEKHKRADKDLNDHVADVTTKKVLDLANNYA